MHLLLSINCCQHFVVGTCAIAVATGTVLLYAYECLPLWPWQTSWCGKCNHFFCCMGVIPVANDACVINVAANQYLLRIYLNGPIKRSVLQVYHKKNKLYIVKTISFWYQILLSPISPCIHFQVWFYFNLLQLFYTKGVFAWDIIYISIS